MRSAHNESILRVAFKRTKDRPLTSYQTRENKRRAKVRARVKHVFDTLETAIGGKRMRCIGRQHASIQIGLQNLSYVVRCGFEFAGI